MGEKAALFLLFPAGAFLLLMLAVPAFMDLLGLAAYPATQWILMLLFMGMCALCSVGAVLGVTA